MERIKWIDIAKGIGIIGVVIIHAYSSTDQVNLRNTLILFVIPLFFFLSGFLSKPADIKKNVIAKTKQLMIPYCVVIILLLPISGIFDFSKTLSTHDILLGLKKLTIGGRYFTSATGTLWFISCLYVTQIVYNIMQNKLSEKMVHLAVILLYILSFVNSILYPGFWVPGDANVILASIPIYHLGYLYKQTSLYKNYSIKELIISSILCAGVMVSVVYFPDNRYDMKYNYYGIPIITLACTIITIICVKYISEALSNNKVLTKIFSNLGESSLIIMYFHMPILIWFYWQIENKIVLVFVALLIPYLMYLIINKFTLTRALFMGSAKDIDSIKNFFNKQQK